MLPLRASLELAEKGLSTASPQGSKALMVLVVEAVTQLTSVPGEAEADLSREWNSARAPQLLRVSHPVVDEMDRAHAFSE